jgi:hypothetical protein|tara:strand:+ start:2318 stop:2461 length:144 start_codon:yes stop_codon:yes gene_type:complete
MKCQKCKKKIKKGEEAYINGLVLHQKCFDKEKFQPKSLPEWLEGIKI